MRARRSAHVAFMVLCDRDSSYVVHGCWFATMGGEMKSLDLDEIIEFIRISYDFSKSARACFLLESLGAKTLGFFVSVKIDMEIITKLVVLQGFRHARAAERA